MPKVVSKKNPPLAVEIVSIVRNESSAITEKEAKEIIGWEAEPDGEKWGDDYVLTDSFSNKVRFKNNANNRPFSESWAKTIAGDILEKNWKMNGETIVIGDQGNVLSGQHRLAAVVIASQEWKSNRKKYPKWDSEPTLDTILIKGISESIETTRTLDNVKPRTVADVLYTSSLFKNYRPNQRKAITRISDYAIRLIWERTKLFTDAFSSKRTNSEAVEFIKNHPTLLECVKLIFEEDLTKAISKIVSPGYAAGLLYLMATSKSNSQKYFSTSPNEMNLDVSLLQKGMEFWVKLPTDKNFGIVRKKITAMSDEEGVGRIKDVLATIIKAWLLFVKAKPITEEGIQLKYSEENDILTLIEFPKIGGIDMGI